MSFKPKFDLDIIDSKLRFRDLTGIYDVTNNEEGWTTPNPALGDITVAKFVLTDSAGVVTEIDVFAELPANLVYEGYFYYPLEDLPSEEDIYKVQYVLETATTTYTSDFQYYLIAPSIDAGITEMYARIEDKINDADLLQYINQVKLAKALKDTLVSLTALGDNNNSKKILLSIERTFTFNVA